MEKPAPVDHPILDLFIRRWSPRAFSTRPVDESTLRTLMEAARWAPSSNNEQPWAFLVATRDEPDEHARLLEMLMPFNQTWAQHAHILVISLTRTNWARDGKPNRHAFHDVGLATSQLILQAVASGLFAHPMAGIHNDKIRETYKLPEDVEPVAAIAIGWPGPMDDLPPVLQEREHAPRTRKEQGSFVFTGTWGSGRHI